jgi:DNA-binding MarR family transcriptional regulator
MEHETAISEAILLRDQSSPCEMIGESSGDPVPAGSAGSTAASAFVRRIIEARAIRRKFFDEQLFADPAWDMLLELYALECEGHRISVSKLSVAAGVPCTTTLRWIDKLESECLIVRAPDPLDARRVWVALSPTGARTMRSYIERVSAVGLEI